MPEPPTLYERLGGLYPIATVVDDFIDRIMVDPRLNANPRVDGLYFPQKNGHGNLVNCKGLWSDQNAALRSRS